MKQILVTGLWTLPYFLPEMSSQQCFLLDNSAFWSLQMQPLSQVSHEETLQKAIAESAKAYKLRNTGKMKKEYIVTPTFNSNIPSNSSQAKRKGAYYHIPSQNLMDLELFSISQTHHNAIKNQNLQCEACKPTIYTDHLTNICCIIYLQCNTNAIWVNTKND